MCVCGVCECVCVVCVSVCVWCVCVCVSVTTSASIMKHQGADASGGLCIV